MNSLLKAWLLMLIAFAHAEEKVDVFKNLETAKEWLDNINDLYKAMENEKPRDILEQTGNLLEKFKILLVALEPEAGIPMDVGIFLLEQAKDQFFPKEKEKTLWEQILPEIEKFEAGIKFDEISANLDVIEQHWESYLRNIKNDADYSSIQSEFDAAKNASMDARTKINRYQTKEIQVRLIPLAVQLAILELFIYRDWIHRQDKQNQINSLRDNLKTEMGYYRELFKKLYKVWEEWRFAKITCNTKTPFDPIPYPNPNPSLDPNANPSLSPYQKTVKKRVVTCSDEWINFSKSVTVESVDYEAPASEKVINRANAIQSDWESKLKSDAVAMIASLLGNLSGLENILPDIDEKSIVPATLHEVWLGPFNAVTSGFLGNVDDFDSYPIISDDNATVWDARKQLPSIKVKDLEKVVLNTVNENQTITCAGEVTMFLPADRSGDVKRDDCQKGCSCTKDDMGYSDGIWTPWNNSWGRIKLCQCKVPQGTCPSESVYLSPDEWIQGVTDVKYGQNGIDAISIVKSNTPLPDDAINIQNFQLTEYKTSQNRCQTNSMKLKFELVDFKKEIDSLKERN